MGNNKIRLEVSKKIEELYFYSNKLIREKGGKIYTGKSELVKVFSDYERFDVILCEIKTEFLTLPVEIIHFVILNKYKGITVVDEKGGLLPYFLAVFDKICEDDLNNKAKALEKNVNDRLKEICKYFPLKSGDNIYNYVDDLKNFNDDYGLGNLYDKTQRIILLSKLIAEKLNLAEETKENIKISAELLYSDRAIDIVKDFPELRGVISKFFFTENSEREAVSFSLYENTLNMNFGTSPKMITSVIVIIADRLDSIIELVYLKNKDKEFSYSKDTEKYVDTIIYLIIKNNLDFNLIEIIKNSIYSYIDYGNVILNYQEISEAVLLIFKENFFDKYCKIEYVLEDFLREDISYLKEFNMLDLYEKIKAMEFLENPDNFDIKKELYDILDLIKCPLDKLTGTEIKDVEFSNMLNEINLTFTKKQYVEFLKLLNVNYLTIYNKITDLNFNKDYYVENLCETAKNLNVILNFYTINRI